MEIIRVCVFTVKIGIEFIENNCRLKNLRNKNYETSNFDLLDGFSSRDVLKRKMVVNLFVHSNYRESQMYSYNEKKVLILCSTLIRQFLIRLNEYYVNTCSA